MNLRISRKLRETMSYATEQRKLILDYFIGKTDESVTALEIAEALSSFVSKSAIYRNLALMEKEGEIVRVQKGKDRAVAYRYAASGKCAGKIHISCLRCGKTEHVSAEAAAPFERALKEKDGFSLSRGECLLYGVCKDCAGGGK